MGPRSGVPVRAGRARAGGLVALGVCLSTALAQGAEPAEVQRAARFTAEVERGLGGLADSAGAPKSAEYLSRAKEDIAQGRNEQALTHLHQALEVSGAREVQEPGRAEIE